MRVLLLINDSISAGPHGGRYHVGPGLVDLDGIPNGTEAGLAWLAAGQALDVDRNGVVRAPAGATLCTAISYDEIAPGVRASCCLPNGHKGSRHYDFSTLGQKGEAIAAGWWNPERAVKVAAAKPLEAPAAEAAELDETPAEGKAKKRTAKKGEV